MVPWYVQATKAVKPHVDYAWEKGSEYAALTSERSSKAYQVTREQALKAWQQAAPTAKQAYATSEVCNKVLSQDANLQQSHLP